LNFIRILLNDYKLFHIAKRERKFFWNLVLSKLLFNFSTKPFLQKSLKPPSNFFQHFKQSVRYPFSLSRICESRICLFFF
jgi:hypothetical protein